MINLSGQDAGRGTGQRALIVASRALGSSRSRGVPRSADSCGRPGTAAPARRRRIKRSSARGLCACRALEALTTATMYFQQTQRALVGPEPNRSCRAPRISRRARRHRGADPRSQARRGCPARRGCAAIAPRDYYAAIVEEAFADLRRSGAAASRATVRDAAYRSTAKPVAATMAGSMPSGSAAPAAPAVLALALDAKADPSVRAPRRRLRMCSTDASRSQHTA